MSAALVDVNVLVALTSTDHIHHERARRWFTTERSGPFVTCPITQLGLVRVAVTLGQSRDEATGLLSSLVAHDEHRFVAADLAVDDTVLRGLVGRRQVTDFYLAALSRRHSLDLTTLDRGLQLAHPDVTTLIAAD